jgi:hypothetical protein
LNVPLSEYNLYYSEKSGNYEYRDEDETAAQRDAPLFIGTDFHCRQTDAFPTFLIYDREANTAWLELSEGTAENTDKSEAARCRQLCDNWGVHACSSFGDYNNLLRELGAQPFDNEEIFVSEDDASPDEDQGMGGLS